MKRVTAAAALCVAIASNLGAQAPRRVGSALERSGVVSSDSVRTRQSSRDSLKTSHIRNEPQEGSEPGAGFEVGWTIAGAVIGYAYWQSHRQEGNMAEPVQLVFLVGAGAVIGTVVGLILR